MNLRCCLILGTELCAPALLVVLLITGPVDVGVEVRGADSAARRVTDVTTTVPRLWKPAADDVYLQESGEQIATQHPVVSIAVVGHDVRVVVDGGIKVVAGDSLRDDPGSPTGVTRVRALDGAVWAASKAGGVWRLADGTWKKVGDQLAVDFCSHRGQVLVATREELFRFEGGALVDAKPLGGWLSSDTTMLQEDFTQLLADPVALGPIQRIASYCETLYLLRDDGLALLDGRTYVPDPIDWGALPSPVLRDFLTQGSRLWVATDRGLGVLRGMAMTAFRGGDGLPYEDTTCLAAGFDNDLWIGTSKGAIRKTSSECHYFASARWLPSDRVNDIAVLGRDVLVATDKGLGIIHYEPFTLAKKAAYLQRELDQGGFKRLGFIHQIHRDGGGKWLREISDNDGGNTAGYLGAMVFRYSVTHEDQARAEALDAFRAMVWLGDITGRRGLIARSVWSVKGDLGERSTRGSGGLPAKWFPTPDGLFLWKGDTSSDEVNAHYYAVSLFHDLAAQSEAEKQRAARHLVDLTSYIIDNGWVLRDLDGKPTRWGRWNPEYLQGPYGADARGLNGMEAQTYVTTAWALSGDEKFQRAIEQTVKWRYPSYTVRQKLTFPPDQMVPWDDELAFRCYVPLLRYATDPDLRSIYTRSLARSWEVQRMQQVPFYNFIYGALTGNDCEVDQAVRHLREWPLDTVSYRFRNSHRSDLAVRGGDYVPYGAGSRMISPRESEPTWGSRPTLVLDGGGAGRTAVPPVCWLEDYWMGRYFGFIQAPTTTEREALVPGPRRVPGNGVGGAAAAYDGPPRPAGD